MAPDPKLTAKVMRLKWSKGITLKEAWKRVSRPKKKKEKKEKKEKKPKKEKTCSCKKEINGKIRTVYTSSRGAKYYKSKGAKVYIK